VTALCFPFIEKDVPMAHENIVGYAVRAGAAYNAEGDPIFFYVSSRINDEFYFMAILALFF
jgi:hypothetical protein